MTATGRLKLSNSSISLDGFGTGKGLSEQAPDRGDRSRRSTPR